MSKEYVAVTFGDQDTMSCAREMLPRTRLIDGLTWYYEMPESDSLELYDPTDQIPIVTITPLDKLPSKLSIVWATQPAMLKDDLWVADLYKMAAIRLLGKHLPSGAGRREAVRALASVLLRDQTAMEDVERCVALLLRVADEERSLLYLQDLQHSERRLRAGESVVGLPTFIKLVGKPVVDTFLSWIGMQPGIRPADQSLVELDARCSKMHLNDIGNAERFVARYGHNVRFCHCWGEWLVWTGEVWGKDRSGQLMRWARETALAIYREIATIPPAYDDKGHDINQGQRDTLAKHAKDTGMHARLEALLKQARSHKDLAVMAEQLDSHSWLYNTPSGTLDLRTGHLTEHRREDLLTKIAPCAYQPEAHGANWQHFLRRVLPDPEVRAYVQRAVGYTLTGLTTEQCLFFLYGSGRNGKSTFLEILISLLGMEVYAVKSRAETIMVKRGSGVPNDVAALCGARLVSVAEVGQDQRLDEALVKDLTGGDTMQARFLYKEYFSFQPSHKLWMYGNHKPVVKGTDTGIWRRIKLIPFEVTIGADEVDPDLPAKLRAELGGILNWAVEGCRLWQEDGLREPQAVQVAVTEYRTEMDTFCHFLEDACVQGAGKQIANTALYEAYKCWCTANGEFQITQTKFSRSLKERGYVQGKSGARYWLGLELADNVDTWDEAPSEYQRDEHTSVSAEFPLNW